MKGIKRKTVYVKRHRRDIGLLDSTIVVSHWRRPPRSSRIKRPLLPPTTLEGIETYLRNRGFRINPTLEHPRYALLTFDKPLPDGRRIHGEVLESSFHWIIKMHFDIANPYKYPYRHLKKDLSVKHRNKTFKVRKLSTVL